MEQHTVHPIDRLSARLSGAPDIVQRAAGLRVVENVFGRQELESAQVQRGKERNTIDGLEPLGIVPKTMELRRAGRIDFAQPAEMIQAEVVEVTYVGPQIERLCDLAEEFSWRIADADDAGAHGPHGLRDDADGVREIDDPRVGRQAGDVAGVAPYVRNGARRHREPCWPGRFLA